MESSGWSRGCLAIASRRLRKRRPERGAGAAGQSTRALLCKRRHQNGMAARMLLARCDSGRRGYRHLTFTHWRGSPFPLARLPPPSITPNTASMPRASLPTARFLTSFVELLSTSKPSSPDRLARLPCEEAVVVLASDLEPILAAPPDHISANDVVGAADRRLIESEVDAVLSSVENDVARNQIAACVLDRDAVSVSREAVAGDHVSVATAEQDARSVSNEAVASYLVAVRPVRPLFAPEQDAGRGVRDQVPLDQVVGGSLDVDAGPGFRRNSLSTIRTSCDSNNPIPSPSGAMLRLPELPRTRICADLKTTKPKKVF